MIKDNFKLNVANALDKLQRPDKDINSEILTKKEFEEENERILEKNTLTLDSELRNK